MGIATAIFEEIARTYSRFPLQQARQSYLSMDVELRRELLTALETAASKHKLPMPTRVCFLLKRNFSPVIGALDLVFIIMALIEGFLLTRLLHYFRKGPPLDPDVNCQFQCCRFPQKYIKFLENMQHILDFAESQVQYGESWTYINSSTLESDIGHVRRVTEFTEIYGVLETPVEKRVTRVFTALCLVQLGRFSYPYVVRKQSREDQRGMDGDHTMSSASFKRNATLDSVKQLPEPEDHISRERLHVYTVYPSSRSKKLTMRFQKVGLATEELPPAEGFQLALSALSTASGSSKAWDEGVAAAKQALLAVARLVNTTIANKRLQLAGPFTYFIVHEGSPEARWVRGPLWLGVAARWAASALGGSRPLLASAPTAASDALTPTPMDTCLLLGVPPKHEHETRNLFGAAFEQAAARAACAVSLDHFDPSVVALPSARRTQFLDALTAILS
ncbi:Cell division control protein 45 homolog [Eumeta japonica]|uniref:Cell division control protein 45 homolog n=1 Tax=Eumeta variegata TaxID=151549 RepID=A0A4C1UCM3_EUMVA|nr:Cell division control protein 45 homolog [Eumeta japonica]